MVGETALALHDRDRLAASSHREPSMGPPTLGGVEAPSALRLVPSGGGTADLGQLTSRPSTAGSQLDAAAFVSPIAPNPRPVQLAHGVVLQKWEGRVESLADDGFVATLTDTSTGGPDELAEFPWEEISIGDRALVEPGAIFYWSIGYKDAVSGQRSRESVIRFRRLPRWSRQDRAEATIRARARTT